jgi:hypothetical protein
MDGGGECILLRKKDCEKFSIALCIAYFMHFYSFSQFLKKVFFFIFSGSFDNKKKKEIQQREE